MVINLYNFLRLIRKIMITFNVEKSHNLLVINFRDYILEYTYGLIIFNPGFQTFSVQFQGKDQKNFLPFSPSYQLLVCQSFAGHQADRVPHHHYGILPADVVAGDEFVDVSVHVFRGEVVECSMIALLQQRPE